MAGARARFCPLCGGRVEEDVCESCGSLEGLEEEDLEEEERRRRGAHEGMRPCGATRPNSTNKVGRERISPGSSCSWT